MPDYANMKSVSIQTSVRQNALIDFRSDTVTRPSEAMRKAIAEADVGDDVYSDDPTVNELERYAAELLGKEQALFVTSGTQSNLTAMLTHCGRGEEYIGGNIYHISHYEAAGAAVLGGISPVHLPVDAHGGLNATDIEAAIKPDDIHFGKTRLVCLENTVNGRVQDQAAIEAIADMAHQRGLSVHLDGARLMNAAVASSASPAVLAAKADTVSVCLSKGLGAPVGSVLCGPGELIHRARYIRKMLGGGMRQAGILAAAGLYALEHNIERLEEDHARAAHLRDVMDEFEELVLDPDKAGTNMIFFRPKNADHHSLQEFLIGQNLLIDGGLPEIRLVVHLDIDDTAIERLVAALKDFFAGSGK